MKKIITLLLLAMTFSACGGQLKKEEQAIAASDERNSGVDFDLFESGRNLRYCVNNLSGEKNPMDVFRILLQTASHLKDRKYVKVELCFRKETRFFLGGAEFKVMGDEFGEQNPMYTIRTFPEKLTLANGENAYETHEGGVLYLMRVQMADFQDMNQKWFMDELLAEMKAEKDAKRPKEFAPDDEVF